MLQYPGKAVFLISKPLQLMVALCIVQQGTWKSKPVLIVVDAFSGASGVAERIANNFDCLQRVVFFTSRKMALAFIKKEKFLHLFIDSDVGIKNFVSLLAQKLANPKISIDVYEEGLGTYRSDLYFGLKKFVLKYFGVGTYFGGCKLVSGIYVFNVNEYKKNNINKRSKVYSINEGIFEFIMRNHDALRCVFGFNGISHESKTNSGCSIYLSNWKLDSSFISYFKNIDGDLFIKPHPHILNCNQFEGITTIKANVPAELVIAELIKLYELVTVFDHKSSVRRYIVSEKLIYKQAQSPNSGNIDGL